MRRLLVPLLLVLAVAAACAGPDAQPGAPGRAAAESAPTSLLADGSVPWADLRITAEDLNGRPAGPRLPSAESKPCRADQLSGRLVRWTRPGAGGETPRGLDAAIGKLVGVVDVRNSSEAECTVQGEVPTTMYAGGREIAMLYTHGMDDEARARVVVVPAGGQVSLRLDWSGPFCQPTEGALELAIEVPHGGGTLRAPITAGDRPGCPQGEGVNPRARATLYASGFTEPDTTSAPPTSPLDQLTVSVAGPPTTTAGSRSTLRVTLGNPTDTFLALDPCPGYLMELFSLGDATDEAVNTAQLYRLNCAPVPQIPAGGAAVFEMVVEMPAPMRAGRELTVTWKLYLPHYVQRGNQFGAVVLPVV
ncbi:hypothetical protein LADH09A_003157 [Micromonospora sp. LAH09]|uniref:hypothetical protein n=1 Tax=Micromonospora cabrerizensis TaxID=2911213 RepID=UPI001EE913A4|nr:hypothetical protein [Micromonospora cabrerizensis]MCG5469249.1 hypothetical protein [Micromonospora cabrerizensis]